MTKWTLPATRAALLAGVLAALAGCASGIGADFTVPAFHVYFALASANLNGSGQPQVAATDFLSGTDVAGRSVALLDGTVGGVPRLSGRVTLAQSPESLAYGDLDGDGLQDLVVLTADYNEASHLGIYLQDPTRPGSYRMPQVVDLPAGGSGVALADLDGDGRLAERLNPETVTLCELTTPEQEALLKSLLEAHLETTGSERAAVLLADWGHWKTRFKVLVPPSEKAAMGLAERAAVAA